MTHPGHKKIICTCGALVSECRCKGDKEVEIIAMGCHRCRSTAVGAIPSAQVSGDITVNDTPLSPSARAVTINITPLVVPDASPPLAAWQVSVETAKTEWREPFGSLDALEAFIKGVRAGAAARGCFDVEVVQ